MTTVLAFEPSGHQRVPTPIFVGDVVEWKRNGVVGTMLLRVDHIVEQPLGGAKVYATPLYGGRQRHFRLGIHHVYSPDGFDRLSGQRRVVRDWTCQRCGARGSDWVLLEGESCPRCYLVLPA